MCDQGITRRGLLSGVGGAVLGSTVVTAKADEKLQAANGKPVGCAAVSALPAGKPLRLKPVLVYHIPQRQEKTSWRMYGGSITQSGIEQEAARINKDLEQLAASAEFPIQLQPVSLVTSATDAAAVAGADADVVLLHAHSGAQAWLETIIAGGKPTIVFVRHRTQPFYFWYETAHWWLLRKLTDEIKEPHLGVGDIVVDDYAEVLWRLRALSGLKNARGTKSIALGGLQAYSTPAAENAPQHVRDVWGYDIQIVEMADLEKRVKAARADAAVTRWAEQQTEQYLAQPGVTLATEKRFVVNTFVSLKVVRDLLAETGGTNIGVAQCMGPLMAMLETTPCLLLSILNDEGITAFCHTDYSHTAPGVLLRWMTGKPPFLCNTHFPHDGVMTLAHCAAPRRMNGRDFRPTKILTHFESDYGAANKVEYDAGQVTTNILPTVGCTGWQGFRGRIIDSPAYDACRSQMNVAIEGDWRALQAEMVGFHAVITYGDYLREVGYALSKMKIAWRDFSVAHA